MKVYELDSARYYTAPGLFWDALFKSTGHKQELLTDINMHIKFEGCTHGGHSGISKRFLQANNKYMNNYDPSKPSKYIVPLDGNNLYGWAMSRPLPIGRYKDATEEEIRNCRNIEGDYIACVDLGYPKHLHDKYNDYPLAPENGKVGKSTKLIASLHDKKRYTLHHKLLKYYESKGLEVQKVHWIVKFEEAEWMKPYVLTNTRMRAQAKNEFEKFSYKLANNLVFGKTIENLRKHVDAKIVTNDKQAKRWANKPNFARFTIIDENTFPSLI